MATASFPQGDIFRQPDGPGLRVFGDRALNGQMVYEIDDLVDLDTVENGGGETFGNVLMNGQKIVDLDVYSAREPAKSISAAGMLVSGETEFDDIDDLQVVTRGLKRTRCLRDAEGAWRRRK